MIQTFFSEKNKAVSRNIGDDIRQALLDLHVPETKPFLGNLFLNHYTVELSRSVNEVPVKQIFSVKFARDIYR